MNLTRPEKKEYHDEPMASNNPRNSSGYIMGYNESCSGWEAYQNQQMEGLEELIIDDFKRVGFDDWGMAKRLATKIRELLSQKGGENEKR